MLKRASIRIKGDVQKAGFRTFIKNTADSLNVHGFARIRKREALRWFVRVKRERLRG